jgi:hypothetical protein
MLKVISSDIMLMMMPGKYSAAALFMMLAALVRQRGYPVGGALASPEVWRKNTLAR